MFRLPIPLVIFIWPLALVFAQSLTPPPVSAPSGTPTSHSASSSSSVSSVSSGSLSSSATQNASSITNVTISGSSTTSTASFPSLSGYSPCVANCLGLAVSADGCNSLVDVECFCSTNSTRFSRSLFSCVESGCPTDLSNAEIVAQQFCNNVQNVTLTFPSASSTATSSSGSSSPTAPPTSPVPSSTSGGPTSTNASSSANGSFDHLRTLGLTVAAAWFLAIVGAAIVR